MGGGGGGREEAGEVAGGRQEAALSLEPVQQAGVSDVVGVARGGRGQLTRQQRLLLVTQPLQLVHLVLQEALQLDVAHVQLHLARGSARHIILGTASSGACHSSPRRQHLSVWGLLACLSISGCLGALTGGYSNY